MYIKTTMSVVEHMKKFIKGIYISGEYRRGNKHWSEIEIITKVDLNLIWELFKFLYDIKISIIKNEENYIRLILKTNTYDITINIYKANDNYQYKFHKWFYNLSKGHQLYYMKQALKNGYTFSPNGLYDNENNGYIEVLYLKDLRRLLNI